MFHKPKIVIFGLGEYFIKIKKGINKNFEPILFIDKDDKTNNLDIQEKFKFKIIKDNRLNNLSKILERADCFMLLTPPNCRINYLNQIVHYKKPIFLEKPLVFNYKTFQKLKDISHNGLKLYCSDFYLDTRFSECIKYLLKKKLGSLKKIHCILYEKNNNLLSKRPWLLNPKYGGVVLDLMYHYLMILFKIFPKDDLDILHKQLYSFDNSWTKNSNTAETKVLISGRVRLVNLSMRISNNEKKKNRYIRFTFSNGYIQINFNKFNQITIFDKLKNFKKIIKSNKDYYNNVPYFFKKFISSRKISHNWLESEKTMKTINIIKGL